jgi:hypothetical protein
VQITSTVEAYLELAAIADPERRVAAWPERYEAAFPEVFATYYSSWGSAAGREQAARSAPELAATIRAREARARELVAAIAASFVAAGLLDSPDLSVVLLVGTGGSNGWVTPYAGRETLFLALERLGEAPYDELLVVHEALHVAHEAAAGIEGWPETVAAGLFMEGFAVAVSRRLRPGHPDSAYLWFDDDHADWVAECEREYDELRAQVLSALDSADDDTVAHLFTTRPGSTLPPRAGYWLGDRMLGDLLGSGRTPAALAGLSYELARRLLGGEAV